MRITEILGSKSLDFFILSLTLGALVLSCGFRELMSANIEQNYIL